MDNAAKVPYQAVLTEIDSTEWPTDFDGSKLDLRPFQYHMGKLDPVTVMVKRGTKDNQISSSTYEILRGVKLPNVHPVEIFYDKGYGWLVIPCIDGTLMGWMQSEHGKSMFQGEGDEKQMSQQFRDMLIDICNGLDKLSQKRIFPRKFGIGDIYIKLVSGIPKIRLLLTDVQKKEFSPSNVDFRGKLDDIITKCCEIRSIQLNHLSRQFKWCISADPKNFSWITQSLPDFLKSYPNAWTTREKECYLMNIVSGGHLPWHGVKSRIRGSPNDDLKEKGSPIDWPRNIHGSVIPELLKIIQLGGKWVKNPDDRFDYIHQCRNCYKHFSELPAENQSDLGGSPQGLIAKMEEWDPNIWIKLYHIFGALVRM
ncbi:unnamed protein product [Urochloa decumbens]|uniref:Uncharacterized protein n=1 Tax=Urochloa decumbens TaxID=240449 RepID=A0ABC9BHP3_9POAL